jgi:two-component system nitrate/nitrite response regulator NarL
VPGVDKSPRIKVLLVDDHAVVRAGLRLLIKAEPRFDVVGDAGNCEEAIAAATETQPDVILLDIDLDGENALNIIPELLNTAASARVLVLTGMNDSQMNEDSLRAGAMGLVLKEKAAEILLKAIEKIHNGEVWYDRSVMGDVLSEMSRGGANHRHSETAKIATLTEREREVIGLIGEGLKNKPLAERLYISETTVRHHLTSIFDKLGVSDRLELVIYAYRHGLAKPPR